MPDREPKPDSEIELKMDGDMATNGQMSLYDAGRSTYGVARFLYVLEQFRQKGEVVEKLTKRVNADIRIGAARRGSFIWDISIYKVVKTDIFLDISLEKLAAYVFGLLFPADQVKERAEEIFNRRTSMGRFVPGQDGTSEFTNKMAIETIEQEISESSESPGLTSHLESMRNELVAFEN